MDKIKEVPDFIGLINAVYDWNEKDHTDCVDRCKHADSILNEILKLSEFMPKHAIAVVFKAAKMYADAGKTREDALELSKKAGVEAMAPESWESN